MKLTAKIKEKTSPTAKLVRRLASRRSVLVIDPMGDTALLKRLMATARKLGRSGDLRGKNPGNVCEVCGCVSCKKCCKKRDDGRVVCEGCILHPVGTNNS